MLAYVFWHWPDSRRDLREYEEALREFHEALSDAAPSGFVKSLAWRVRQVPWLPEAAGYEDWYLLEDSGALDRLEYAAVSGPMQAVHGRVAGLAAGGTAGLYKPVGAVDADGAGTTALWCSKPARLSYVELDRQVQEIQIQRPAEHWRRMMTLGPTPESCLIGEGEFELPPEWSPVVVRRERVWPR